MSAGRVEDSTPTWLVAKLVPRLDHPVVGAAQGR
jgi:hypothetical protein